MARFPDSCGWEMLSDFAGNFVVWAEGFVVGLETFVGSGRFVVAAIILWLSRKLGL